MKPFTVPGLLRAAASYIEIHGHEQRPEAHGGNTFYGACCPILAFSRKDAGDPVGRLAMEALSAEVSASCALDLALWSDRTPTAEVLATMRRVARELDGA